MKKNILKLAIHVKLFENSFFEKLATRVAF
jgi:hypothetical protein